MVGRVGIEPNPARSRMTVLEPHPGFLTGTKERKGVFGVIPLAHHLARPCGGADGGP